MSRLCLPCLWVAFPFCLRLGAFCFLLFSIFVHVFCLSDFSPALHLLAARVALLSRLFSVRVFLPSLLDPVWEQLVSCSYVPGEWLCEFHFAAMHEDVLVCFLCLVGFFLHLFCLLCPSLFVCGWWVLQRECNLEVACFDLDGLLV